LRNTGSYEAAHADIQAGVWKPDITGAAHNFLQED
jgi:hypothetical protein